MDKKNTLLWEIIQKSELKGYLFGTMHIPGEIAFPNFNNVLKLVEECSAFAPEISLDADSQKEVSKHMMLPGSTHLIDLIGEKKWNKMSKILKKSFDLELIHFNRVLPLFLLNYITQLSLNVESNLLNHSMDFQLWEHAKAHNLKLESVESITDHIETLYSIPLTYQISSLHSALKNVSKFKEKTLSMLNLYRNQELHNLYKYSKKSLGEIRSTLLYKRNNIMINNIKDLLSMNQKIFIGVGAAHLSGKKGIIHVLKSEGYDIKPYRMD